MLIETLTNKNVSLWKKIHVIYSFFFVRKIIADIGAFIFFCIVLPATVPVPEVTVPKWGAVYILSIITLLNATGTPRSPHLIVLWILFENVMSLYRTKVTLIGLLEAGTDRQKLGDALKAKAAAKAPNKPRSRFGERMHMLELGVGACLCFADCYCWARTVISCNFMRMSLPSS